MGARRVVITLGDRGVISFSDSLQVRLGVYPVDYVDGSGGGDAFNAGYILGLLEDRPELESLKLASAVGASSSGPSGRPTACFRDRRPKTSSAATRSSSNASREFPRLPPRRSVPEIIAISGYGW